MINSSPTESSGVQGMVNAGVSEGVSVGVSTGASADAGAGAGVVVSLGAGFEAAEDVNTVAGMEPCSKAKGVVQRVVTVGVIVGTTAIMSGAVS